MLQAILESAFLLVAFGVGLYSYKTLNLLYKVIFYQVVIAVMVYVASYAITTYQRSLKIPENNQWLFNVYVLLEAVLLMTAAWIFFRERKLAWLIAVGFLIFLLAFLYQVYDSGFFQFVNYALVTEGILIVVFYLIILYIRFTSPGYIWYRSPEFWLCIGVTIYFAGIVPFYSMLKYLYTHHQKLSGILFHLINDVLGNVRYLCIALSFFLFFKQASAPTPAQHELV